MSIKVSKQRMARLSRAGKAQSIIGGASVLAFGVSVALSLGFYNKGNGLFSEVALADSSAPAEATAQAELTTENATATATPTPLPSVNMNQPVSVRLVPYADPWSQARERYWDIDDRPLDKFIARGYNYSRAYVRITYDAAPSTPYFIGHVYASNLKPNFCYQIKLAGKPTSGVRGWRNYGDDVANENIGEAGRWWCDTQQSNVDDLHYRQFYLTPAPANRHSIYGYQLMGIFVTDANGNVNKRFSGRHSFHVTWQDKQNVHQEYFAGAYTIGTASPYLGYGHPVPSKRVRLWLEYESGRNQPVRLPPGNYNCRFFLTEESFHNFYSGTQSEQGGLWRTVLANEDFIGGSPDTNRTNDIVFRIQ